jgi:hypothetical protein
MDRVGFEPMTAAPWQLFQALLFIPYVKGADMKRQQQSKSHPVRLFFLCFSKTPKHFIKLLPI